MRPAHWALLLGVGYLKNLEDEIKGRVEICAAAKVHSEPLIAVLAGKRVSIRKKNIGLPALMMSARINAEGGHSRRANELSVGN